MEEVDFPAEAEQGEDDGQRDEDEDHEHSLVLAYEAAVGLFHQFWSLS